MDGALCSPRDNPRVLNALTGEVLNPAELGLSFTLKKLHPDGKLREVLVKSVCSYPRLILVLDRFQHEGMPS